MIDREQIRVVVNEIFERVLYITNPDPTRSFEDWGIDSLDRMICIIEIEKRFNVKLTLEQVEIATNSNINGTIDYMYKFLNQKNSGVEQR